MQSEAPLTLILSPLRAGRGELDAPVSDPCSVTGHSATAGSPLPLQYLFSVRSGCAPASGAANRALAVGTVRCPEPSDRDLPCRRGCLPRGRGRQQAGRLRSLPREVSELCAMLNRYPSGKGRLREKTEATRPKPT